MLTGELCLAAPRIFEHFLFNRYLPEVIADRHYCRRQLANLEELSTIILSPFSCQTRLLRPCLRALGIFIKWKPPDRSSMPRLSPQGTIRDVPANLIIELPPVAGDRWVDITDVAQVRG